MMISLTVGYASEMSKNKLIIGNGAKQNLGLDIIDRCIIG